MARPRKGQRPPQPYARRLLIVTEDEKAAPTYFEEVRHGADLAPARVVIDGSCGSDPDSVVKRLIETWKEEARGLRRGEIPFERAYAVVDRDEHDAATFGRAKDRLVQTDASIRESLIKYADDLATRAEATSDNRKAEELRAEARAIQARVAEPLLVFSVSYPCFEYWLLCHFSYSRAEIVGQRGKSPGEMAESMTREAFRGQDWPEYHKGMRGVWERTRPLFEGARENAARSRSAARKDERENPSTNVDEIVDAILALER